jgi:hypothetical protein
MITLNLNDIKIKSELLLILEEMKGVNDSILLYDMPEGSRLGPLDKNNKTEYILFSIAHEILQYHKFDVWYLCSDLNIKNRYTKWRELLNIEKKFKVLSFPFTVKHDGVDYIKQQHVDYFNNTQKKKNFIQLICFPTTSRIATVDRYYKHRNYDYSLVPRFHFEPLEDIQHYMPIKCSDLGNFDGQLLSTDQFKNGFDVEKNVRILTEVELSNIWLKEKERKGWVDQTNFDTETITVNGKILDKGIFNMFLPKESFQSCCDVVLETYLNGPTYFTEKTWKQIVLERPFIMIGAKGINHHLRDLGFELYDEIFNYDYDLEDNDLVRLKGFWAQIERYLDFEVSEFEKKLELIKEKLIHNRNVYMEKLSFIDKTLQQLADDCYLFHYLYLHPTNNIAKHQHLFDDHFEIIKKTCLGLYKHPERICDLK